MESIEGKVALVTGSSRGLGREMALSLAGHGANVAVNYRTRDDKAREVVREIESMGSRAISVGADVGDPEQCEALIREVADSLGGIDILVNNAGIYYSGRVEDVDSGDLDRLFATNIKSAFFVTGPAVRLMKESGWGRIINISSVIGVRGYKGDSMYATTKSALFGFTKSLARELARFNITVNAVVPGFVETDMVLQKDDEVLAKVLEKIPMRRWGTSGEVADVVTFLCEGGSYITGQLFTVDGGFSI
ncbi:MAG: 3-oxoacyl-ACP reductase FabG [Actinobacteria bacterium]|nr:3-oxoacyl-ACP reductase FabG [Actinomycetota bacterium]MCG2819751.1 3-oxoacyl-ACP reductase FabG [Actinomycetes bacterium]MBU4179108.1 3-oxoacyl-ACP reductase FabG [Actinomycetota bacterium]MBU4219255.1 3-oxoacyl-ACP reductase FabG [Actinomycetota bacterium]MBU4359539.1 3-oxoacyl-ACP reductase FabG [Actinomycetota bacterium]